MAGSKSTIVLCEDEAQRLFIYRWLVARGLHPGEIRLLPLAAGMGAGTQHVLVRYPGEVGEYRTRANHVAARRLIVAIDADTSTVQQRLAALDAALGQQPRQRTERICLLVPRRNVETWLHFLSQNTVTEEADYKAQYAGDALAPACERAGAAFETWHHAAQPTPGSPASLIAARAEATRV